jgi:hypothetical protein
MKPSPAARGTLIPLARGLGIYAAPELPRVAMFAEPTTGILIPRELVRARSRHGAQNDLPFHRLQVAEQLLALVSSPDKPILRTAPRTAEVARAVEPASAHAMPVTRIAQAFAGSQNWLYRPTRREHRFDSGRRLYKPQQTRGFSVRAVVTNSKRVPKSRTFRVLLARLSTIEMPARMGTQDSPGPATGLLLFVHLGRLAGQAGGACFPRKAQRLWPPGAPSLVADTKTLARPQATNRAENASTVGIEDRWYMRRTPPPPRPPTPPRRSPPSRQPGRPSPQPLPRRRTGAGIRLLIIALVGIILILATMLTALEAQRCREGSQAPVCRI